MPRAGVLLALAVVAAGCRQPAPDPIVRAGRDILLKPDFEVITGRVPRRATLAGLLAAHQVSREIAGAVVAAARTTFDPRQLRADRPYRIERTFDGLVRVFEYEIDAERFLRIVRKLGEHGERMPIMEAAVVPFDTRREVARVDGAIDRDAPSLFAAMDRVGEAPELSEALADIFAGEVDFTHDLQPGDTFGLVFERLSRENRFGSGEPLWSYGAILAAEFVNGGRMLRAIRFQPAGERPGYYDEQGRSLRRFFLMSPLKYAALRVTSRFSYRRLHPIHRTYRAHLGVDYGAPEGTPVVAVASGVVTFAGTSGESGRMVRIRHAGGYETFYLHLSRIEWGVRPGARVEQGEQIGRVGSTGAATGPHLDFRVTRNGAFVNPLRLARGLPAGDPVPDSERARFAVVRDRVLAQLAGSPALASVSQPPR